MRDDDRTTLSRSPPCGELSPKATEGSVADSFTARSDVAESETDPLIRFADLSPARRGTAKVRMAASRFSTARCASARASRICCTTTAACAWFLASTVAYPACRFASRASFCARFASLSW